MNSSAVLIPYISSLTELKRNYLGRVDSRVRESQLPTLFIHLRNSLNFRKYIRNSGLLRQLGLFQVCAYLVIDLIVMIHIGCC